MPLFMISENPDPLLSVHLDVVEHLVVAPESLVALSEGLHLDSEHADSVLYTLTQVILRGNRPRRQLVEATGTQGDILIAPVFPGGIVLFEVGEITFKFSSHAFLASSSGVCLKKTTSPLYHGGSPILEATGNGTLVLACYGSMCRLQVEDEKPILANSEQLVAWDSRLILERVSSARLLLFGRQKKIPEALLRVRGKGSLYMASRRPDAMLRTLLRHLPPGMRAMWRMGK